METGASRIHDKTFGLVSSALSEYFPVSPARYSIVQSQFMLFAQKSNNYGASCQ